MTQPHPTPNVPQYRPWKVAVPLPSDAALSPETKDLLSQGAPIHVLRMFAGAQDMYPGIFTLIKEIFTAQPVFRSSDGRGSRNVLRWTASVEQE
jgi:hypothetical protein